MSNRKTEIAQRFIAKSIDLLRSAGFTLSLEFELAQWVAFMETTGTRGIINPTFNPQYSDIEPGTGLWLRISDKQGTVACAGLRLLMIENFAAEVTTGRIFFRDAEQRQAPAATLDPNAFDYGGRVGHAGGLFVHDRAKKQGLSWLITRLCRAIATLQWSVDRQCGLAMGVLYGRGFCDQIYGFQDIDRVIDGYFPPTDCDAVLYMNHITSDDLVDQLAADLVAFENHPTGDLRDLAPIVGERQQKPAIRARVG